MRYDHAEIELRWQDEWERTNAFHADVDRSKPKFYCLEMFPYPSGKIHMGHVRNYTIGDVLARFKTLQNYNVLHPMGWDSFGMPAENAAMASGGLPKEWTYSNIEVMKSQMRPMGWTLDWTREFATCDPDYYGKQQELFLDFLSAGLVYRKNAVVNWDPVDMTVLANEQVIEGDCERCDSEVTKKNLNQWFFKISNYSEELLQGLSDIGDWPENVKSMQENWIGKSTGVQFNLKIDGSELDFDVFTTRPDTLFGMTFAVMSPEHKIMDKILSLSPNSKEIQSYIDVAKSKSEFERMSITKEKTGVDTGLKVTNPINNKSVPLWIADYVLINYGTGAIMAVPGHDERDYEFAKKYNIEIIQVIIDKDQKIDISNKPFIEKGVLINSGDYDGLNSHDEASDSILNYLSEQDLGERKVTYRLRDWLISRQRYWGCPIPLINCTKCGLVPESLDNLPVLLPEIDDYKNSEDSPLAKSEDFINTKCPDCGSDGIRETDTMDTFVDSSWYFLRYLDSQNQNSPFDKNIINSWLPIDPVSYTHLTLPTKA